jgi:hypothetical protein
MLTSPSALRAAAFQAPCSAMVAGAPRSSRHGLQRRKPSHSLG